MGPQQLMARLCEALGIPTEGRRIVGLTLELNLRDAPRVQIEEITMQGGDVVPVIDDWEIRPKRQRVQDGTV